MRNSSKMVGGPAWPGNHFIGMGEDVDGSGMPHPFHHQGAGTGNPSGMVTPQPKYGQGPSASGYGGSYRGQAPYGGYEGH